MTDEQPVDAYSLLSRPVLELTDAEVEVIVTDLRRKRELFVSSAGKTRDTPGKAKASKPTDESKKAATADLLAGLNLKLGDMKI